jgi:hypothetical protein
VPCGRSLNWRRQRAFQPTLRPGRLLDSVCLHRSSHALTDHIITQGRALVRAIEDLQTIQPSGPFERALACLLMAAYKRGCVACAVF